MNVVLKLFALQPGRHSPAETLAGFGPRMAKSGCFPFLCFLLSRSSGPARFVAGDDTLNRGGRPTAAMPLNLKRGAGTGWRHNPVLRLGNRVSTYSALFMPFALFVLASCNLSNQPKLPKPPFETPIDLSRGGVVADFDIRVPKHRIYYFRLLFEYPEEDQAQRAHVRKLVGDYGRDKDNNLIEPGILTPVKLTIFKKQNQRESITYQRIIKDPEMYAYGSDYFAKRVSHCDLKRGEYRFVLESLAQRQEYASIPTKFHITFPSIFKFSYDLKDIDRSKTCPQ